MATVREQLRLIGLSLSHAAADGDFKAVHKWADRALALVEPAPHASPAAVAKAAAHPVAIGDFFVDSTDDAPYLLGGSPGNPNGVTFTPSTAIAWWRDVFTAGLNISHVRPTLMPGSHVLNAEGVAAARKLGVESTDFAPEDFNPLGLPIVP